MEIATSQIYEADKTIKYFKVKIGWRNDYFIDVKGGCLNYFFNLVCLFYT